MVTPIWGLRDGYCYWCNEFVDDEPIWKPETLPNGVQVIIACCLQCAIDKGVINL
jgi:hypothetical protein